MSNGATSADFETLRQECSWYLTAQAWTLAYRGPQMIGFGSSPGSCTCQEKRDICLRITSEAWI